MATEHYPVVPATGLEAFCAAERHTPVEGANLTRWQQLHRACIATAPTVAGAVAQHSVHAAMLAVPLIVPSTLAYWAHDPLAATGISATLAAPFIALWHHKSGKYRSWRRWNAVMAVNVVLITAPAAISTLRDPHSAADYEKAFAWYETHTPAEQARFRDDAAAFLGKDVGILTRQELGRHLLANCGDWLRKPARPQTPLPAAPKTGRAP